VKRARFKSRFKLSGFKSHPCTKPCELLLNSRLGSAIKLTHKYLLFDDFSNFLWRFITIQVSLFIVSVNSITFTAFRLFLGCVLFFRTKCSKAWVNIPRLFTIKCLK